jgi:hypothetical protein
LCGQEQGGEESSGQCYDACDKTADAYAADEGVRGCVVDKLREHMLAGAGEVRRDPVRTADGLMSDRFGCRWELAGERKPP